MVGGLPPASWRRSPRSSPRSPTRPAPEDPLSNPNLDPDGLARWIMAKCDRHNNNGLLTVSELRTFLPEHRFTAWLFQQRGRLRQYDVNADGGISLDELREACRDFLGAPEPPEPKPAAQPPAVPLPVPVPVPEASERPSWFGANIRDPVMRALKTGLNPHQVALAVAFGGWGGLFPIPGTTTFVCVGFTVAFGLNAVLVQVINWGLLPVNISLIPAFMMLGQRLFLPGSDPIGPEALIQGLQQRPVSAIAEFGRIYAVAIFTWVCLTPGARTVRAGADWRGSGGGRSLSDLQTGLPGAGAPVGATPTRVS